MRQEGSESFTKGTHGAVRCYLVSMPVNVIGIKITTEYNGGLGVVFINGLDVLHYFFQFSDLSWCIFMWPTTE